MSGDVLTGAAVIAEAEEAIAGFTSGDSIFIANNVSYVPKLNDGSSAQAPAQFVEAAGAVGARAAKPARGLN